MRFESSVTSVTWIPSEAITGPYRLPMDLGIGHYDDPPPDVIEGSDELQALVADDRFRFANELRGWIEVEDGRIVSHGRTGGGHLGGTTVRVGRFSTTIAAVAYPDLQPEPELGGDYVKFTQTAGGRTGSPMPRRVSRPPYVQFLAPTAWTTLTLTLYADGRSEHELTGASPFPRHWIYDAEGKLAGKSGLTDFKSWSLKWFGANSPWGDQDSPALVTAVETALERELSTVIMRGGAKPKKRKIAAGDTLVEQGEEGQELFLLLDGVLSIEVDGEPLGDLGPGAILGERAVLEGGRRTSTLRAVTSCTVAVASADQVQTEALAEVAKGHRREDD